MGTIKSAVRSTFFAYDADGNKVRIVESTRARETVADKFGNLDAANWSFSGQQSLATSNGQPVILNTGTGVSYGANFTRTTGTLKSGQSASIDFRLDQTNTGALFSIENYSGSVYSRFGIWATDNVIQVQYNANGAGWTYPITLVNPVKTNTWYRLKLSVDDVNGFSLRLRQRDTVSPTTLVYTTTSMPAGRTWAFHHWTYRGAPLLDNYTEMGAGANVTMTYLGGHAMHNVSTNVSVNYYSFGGQLVGQRHVNSGGASTALYWLSGDHLGSASLRTDASGNKLGEARYLPFGETRYATGRSR